MKFSFAFCVLCAGFAWVLGKPSSAQAQSPQTVVSYTFADTAGRPAAAAPGVQGSEFVRDASADTFYDHSAGNPAPDANSNDWSMASNIDTRLYYTFTVTPAAGGTSWNALTLDVADFDAASINDGPTRFAVRSSLDGFTSNLLTGTVGSTFTTATTALNVTSKVPVEYRIYGFGAGSTGGLFQIDNVALTFAAPVPEPSTLLWLGLAAFAAWLVFTHRRV